MSPESVPIDDSREDQAASAARRDLRLRVLTAVSVTAALLFAGLFFHVKRQSAEQAVATVAASQQVDAELAQARRWQALVVQRQKALREANALIELMARPSTMRCILSGDSGQGQVFVAPDATRLALFAFGLPDPGDGMHYRAWGRLPSGVASLGVLSDDAGGFRTLFMAPPSAEIQAVQVSLERETSAEAGGETVLNGSCSVVTVDEGRSAGRGSAD